MILISRKLISKDLLQFSCRVWPDMRFLDHRDQISLQSVPKLWHVECWSILSSVQCSASLNARLTLAVYSSSSPLIVLSPICPSKLIPSHWTEMWKSMIHPPYKYYPRLRFGVPQYYILVEVVLQFH